MEIESSEFFPGEYVLLSKKASAFLNWIETFEGTIYLTNYRLIFKSYKSNYPKGKFSIFLPTIEGVKEFSFLLTQKIVIVTTLTNFVFLVRELPTFIEAVENAKIALQKDDIARIQQYEKQYQEKN